MAKRYSGNLQINVTYDDHGHYRCSISSGGKNLWSGQVNPAPAGFGKGVAYDSPKAYDKIASSALTFADHDVHGLGDDAEPSEDGWAIHRSAPKHTSTHHVAKRGKAKTAHLERDIHRALGTGFRVAYLHNARKTFVPGTLTLEHATQLLRDYKRRGFTVWIEDTHGSFVPVKGATRKPRHL